MMPIPEQASQSIVTSRAAFLPPPVIGTISFAANPPEVNSLRLHNFEGKIPSVGSGAQLLYEAGPFSEPIGPLASPPPTSATPLAHASPSSNAPGDFAVFSNNPVQSDTPFMKNLVNEPSVANTKNVVFYTGNWYAARSGDYGATWAYTNPYNNMSEFCCDQDVLYNPSRSIFLWYRQGDADSSGSNRFRLGVSPDAEAWFFYDLHPYDVNPVWTGQWFDYPSLAFSNNYLYITTNTFAGGTFKNSVILRWPLDALKNGQGFTYYYYFSADVYTFAPVQGASSVMYWSSHVNEGIIRLYTWDETSTSPLTSDIGIPPFLRTSRGEASCPAPDGGDICARTDDRILGGWVSNGIIGFLWNVKQGSGFPYPYIYVVRITEGTKAFLDSPIIWSQNLGWIYGWASPNARGHLGLVAFIAGAGSYPTLVAGIYDDFTPKPPPWQFYTIRASTDGPEASCLADATKPCWGDYLRVRPLSATGYVWVASGFTLQGGRSSSSLVPWHFVFGRARDNPLEFSVSNSGDIRLTQGNSGSNKITVALLTGPSQSVALSCGVGLPSGASCSFSPGSASPPFMSTLTVAASPSTPVGSYAVTAAGDGGGRTNTTQFTLTVAKPLQVFISANPESGVIPFTVTFGSNVNGGFAPYTYAWAFGDGGTSDQATPAHTYRSPGAHTVTLGVNDAIGSSVTGTIQIMASVLPLQVSVTANPSSGVEALTVAFSTTVSGGLEPYTYSWTFGDAGAGSGANPTHTYQRAGSFMASLVVTDSLGSRKTINITVAVIAVMATLASVETSNGTAPLTVRFHASPSGGLGPYSFNWDFGDGQQSRDQSPTHTYTAAGTYTATLEVKDGSGQTNTKTFNIAVKQPTSAFASPPALIAEIGAAAAAAVGGVLLVMRRRRKVPPPPPPP